MIIAVNSLWGVSNEFLGGVWIDEVIVYNLNRI